ncbi:zinc-finger homeodomain protein 6-like [Durio zibethinus]|uniref:Zinc-finger homeodomain protein 6-like n=1 Tax=Durio zibethinus TaxID=66656 RepID=A0A6P5X9L4_DURZI|nr:zinc-finger homeodomain protein 6-like [Durio zibethinus]
MDDNDKSNNGAGHEGQAQPKAVRRRLNCQAVGEQAGDTNMECRRNISLSACRYTVDGCSEFLKGSAGENPMLCAACGCHRSFHRKVVPTHFRNYSNYLLFNGIPFVRPVQQPLQPPLPLMPQPEIPHELVAESASEEEGLETDEASEKRSELDSETIMEKERNTDQTNINAVLEVQASSVRGINREGGQDETKEALLCAKSAFTGKCTASTPSTRHQILHYEIDHQQHG